MSRTYRGNNRREMPTSSPWSGLPDSGYAQMRRRKERAEDKQALIEILQGRAEIFPRHPKDYRYDYW